MDPEYPYSPNDLRRMLADADEALAKKTGDLEELNMAWTNAETTNNLKVHEIEPDPTTASGSYYARWDGDESRNAFDPKDVDWGSLMKLYQDDPLLLRVFEGMKEVVKRDRRYQSGSYFTATTGSHLSGTLSSTGTTTWSSPITGGTSSTNVSTPVTLTFDTGDGDGDATFDATTGTVTVNYDYSVEKE